jgi:hypothetical protein
LAKEIAAELRAKFRKVTMVTGGYDIVGDIHGHADPLYRLLDTLGYVEIEGIFRHPSRKMIFVGDFIDRGPKQQKVLSIARSMCEAGSANAVLGNHEFNAIGCATPKAGGGFLRSHTDKSPGGGWFGRH